jgi:hypothetical protein
MVLRNFSHYLMEESERERKRAHDITLPILGIFAFHGNLVFIIGYGRTQA